MPEDTGRLTIDDDLFRELDQADQDATAAFAANDREALARHAMRAVELNEKLARLARGEAATTAPDDTIERLRERYATVVTRWALMYPLANWPWPGRTLAGDDAERLDAIARNIAAAWGRDISDRMLAVRDDELEQLRARVAGLEARVRSELARLAGSDNIGVVRQHVIDRITAALDGGK